jgi:hypothetical protein
MRNIVLIAVLLAPALLAAPARAADPALVAGIETYLRDDEKAFLAAILTHPDLSAQFDADAPLALKDTKKNLTPFLGVWRAKLEAYAEADGKLGDPNLDGHYTSFTQLMTAPQKAYMMRRMKTMKEEDRDSLIDYLKSVNDALAKNGELSWYTKKVVSGIMKQYRQDLNSYVATPLAQTAKRDAAVSAQNFAAVKKADEDARLAAAKPAPPAPAEVADAPAAKHPVKPVPPKKPATKPATTPAKPETDDGGVAVTKPSGGALDQAADAANRGANGGQVMDGGGISQRPASGGAVIAPPSNGGTARPTLPAGKPGSEAGLAAALPAVPAPAGDDMDALLKMRGSKPRPTSWIQRAPAIAGGLLGGLLGAVIGFFVGGPVGAVIGGVVGLGAGAGGGYLLGKKLFQ